MPAANEWLPSSDSRFVSEEEVDCYWRSCSPGGRASCSRTERRTARRRAGVTSSRTSTPNRCCLDHRTRSSKVSSRD